MFASTRSLFCVVALATIMVTLTAATNVILGTDAPDHLVGTPGADKINGRGGADTMVGLAGKDTYIVDDGADQVVEQAGGGTDTVRVYGWYALPDYVENLTVAGTEGGGGLGNDLANRMVGNSASNDLDGGPGNDTLTGHAGPDDFIFHSPMNANTNVDRVTDFNVEEDSIQLGFIQELLFWHCSRPPTSWFGSLIVYNPTNGDLSYNEKLSATPDVRFAKLSPNLALKAGNFIYGRSRICP